MDITPLINADQQIIQSYSEGRFRVSGVVHEQPIIVLPSGTFHWPVIGTIDALTLQDFEIFEQWKAELDVVLLGSGGKAARPNEDVRQGLKTMRLNVDFMDSGAACRTYNVLMAEGRRVAAALLPVNAARRHLA